jgi:hypothetical protein
MHSDKPSATIPAKKVWVPPTPEQVNEVLMKAIGHLPQVTQQSPITFMSFNGRYLNKEKAVRLERPLTELFTRAHVICVQETTVDALRQIGRTIRYGLNASHRSSREQANGILFHPRFQWLGDAPIYHDYLKQIPGHPEMTDSLRAGIERRIADTASDFVADVGNMHTKSNVTKDEITPEETQAMRRWQFQALVDNVDQRQQEKVPFILGGDYNAPIENPETTEIEPLLAAGFTRIGTPDNRWSYKYFEKGGQFDGFFVRGLDGYVIDCFIPQFFTNRRDAAFMRELSDHLPVFMTIRAVEYRNTTSNL